MSESFPGFTREALQFLADLAANNERTWFQPRKGEYERLLKGPLEALCAALAQAFEARHVPLAADPTRSPFRIYRDVRFSKDKSPYKPYVSASFPWAGAGGGVGGYFHLQPGEVFVGGGMWHPAPARLAAWRAAVVDDGDRVHAALDEPAFRAAFGDIAGDRLKRVPAGFAGNHPDAELLKLKDVTFGRRLSDEEALAVDLPATIADTLGHAGPFLALLAGLPGHEERAVWLRG